MIEAQHFRLNRAQCAALVAVLGSWDQHLNPMLARVAYAHMPRGADIGATALGLRDQLERALADWPGD